MQQKKNFYFVGKSCWYLLFEVESVQVSQMFAKLDPHYAMLEPKSNRLSNSDETLTFGTNPKVNLKVKSGGLA